MGVAHRVKVALLPDPAIAFSPVWDSRLLSHEREKSAGRFFTKPVWKGLERLGRWCLLTRRRLFWQASYSGRGDGWGRSEPGVVSVPPARSPCVRPSSAWDPAL